MGCEIHDPKCTVAQGVIVNSPGICRDVVIRRSGAKEGIIVYVSTDGRLDREVVLIMSVVKD